MLVQYQADTQALPRPALLSHCPWRLGLLPLLLLASGRSASSVVTHRPNCCPKASSDQGCHIALVPVGLQRRASFCRKDCLNPSMFCGVPDSLVKLEAEILHVREEALMQIFLLEAKNKSV